MRVLEKTNDSQAVYNYLDYIENKGIDYRALAEKYQNIQLSPAEEVELRIYAKFNGIDIEKDIKAILSCAYV